MDSLPSKLLSTYLKETNNVRGILNYLKIVYRPYICPFSQILNLIPEETSVIDIGCGQGQFVQLLFHFKNPVKILGLEISEKLLTVAKSLMEKKEENIVKFQIFNGIDFPEIVQEYNIITLIDVYHHVPKTNRFTFLQNLYKKMSFGSKLIIKDIEARNPLVIFNKFHDLIIAGEVGNEISCNAMKELLHEIGFKIILQERKILFWYPHYWLVVEK